MKDHNIDAEKVFRLMDDNKTGLISYDEFQEWLFKISARKFTA
jgi:Ca2+-binding EF-hand superfamily protein